MPSLLQCTASYQIDDGFVLLELYANTHRDSQWYSPYYDYNTGNTKIIASIPDKRNSLQNVGYS
jgi:hypothetical protein